jgi:hypothetical protein
MPKRNKKIKTTPKIEDKKKVEKKNTGNFGFKKTYLITVLIILLVLFVSLGIYITLKHYKKPISQLQQIPKLIVEEAKENSLMEGKSAIALGLVEAQKWQADAELSYVLSADAGQLKGRSDNWQLIYVSPSNKGKGFQVKIADAKISETKEITYTGQAAEFPTDVLSQAEAVAKVRAMVGYENVKILSIGMIYSEVVNTWYWGVKTERGTVTVIAAKGTESKK